jgi:hypothetical protein
MSETTDDTTTDDATTDGATVDNASLADKSAGRGVRRRAADRARKRAIRARANSAGVPYLVAARHLTGSLEASARHGRTVYPDSSDDFRLWLIALREQRPYDQRVRDTRRAIELPLGRAAHLVERFPPLRGAPGTGVARLYDGEARRPVLAMLYATVLHEYAGTKPSADELTWLAGLGEETAVDHACVAFDRAARELLDLDRWHMWAHIDAALRAHAQHEALAEELWSLAARSCLDGVRQTLDALLAAEAGGHAPGTRVRIVARPYRGRTATIVGARWAQAGRPIGYDVTPDSALVTVAVEPGELTLLEQDPTRIPV